MRTADDLNEAAAGAGLRVTSIESVPIAGGGDALATRMSFDDPWAAARLLFQLADQDAADPVVRAWAYEMLAATAAELGEPAGPRITPELRDAVARTLHANVQGSIRFVHEPVETFQSARVTMQSGGGDCDDHARLVYALAHAINIPVELVFFEQDEQPIHVVARMQDSDGTWQWAETTIAAEYGEDPHAALDRLRAGGELEPESDPMSHAIEGPWGVVTAGDVQARKDQVNAQVESDDADAAGCKALDGGSISAWNLFVEEWRSFYADEPAWYNAGAQGRQVADYVDQLAKWEAKLKAAGCTLSAPGMPAQGDNGASVIKVVAISAAVIAGAFGVWEVSKLLPRAKR